MVILSNAATNLLLHHYKKKKDDYSTWEFEIQIKYSVPFLKFRQLFVGDYYRSIPITTDDNRTIARIKLRQKMAAYSAPQLLDFLWYRINSVCIEKLFTFCNRMWVWLNLLKVVQKVLAKTQFGSYCLFS